MDITQPITTLPPEWQAQINEMFRQFDARDEARRKAAEAKREEERKTAEAEFVKKLALERKEREEKFAIERDEREKRIEKEIEKERKEREKNEKEWNKRLNRWADRIGDIVSEMVEGNIISKFRKMGYSFDKCARRVEFENKKLAVFGEIDLFLEDGDTALLIEVKTKLETADVREHIERMEKYRRYADVKKDKRHFIAAVAGAVVEKQVIKFAVNEGMYVIVQSGDATKIVKPPEGFKAREW